MVFSILYKWIAHVLENPENGILLQPGQQSSCLFHAWHGQDRRLLELLGGSVMNCVKLRKSELFRNYLQSSEAREVARVGESIDRVGASDNDVVNPGGINSQVNYSVDFDFLLQHTLLNTNSTIKCDCIGPPVQSFYTPKGVEYQGIGYSHDSVLVNDGNNNANKSIETKTDHGASSDLLSSDLLSSDLLSSDQEENDAIPFDNYNRTQGFLEIGASDGQYSSNTLFLETQLGWKGLCIEASFVAFQLLTQYRPLCANVNVVVADRYGDRVWRDHLSDHSTNGGTTTSGTSSGTSSSGISSSGTSSSSSSPTFANGAGQFANNPNLRPRRWFYPIVNKTNPNGHHYFDKQELWPYDGEAGLEEGSYYIQDNAVSLLTQLEVHSNMKSWCQYASFMRGRDVRKRKEEGNESNELNDLNDGNDGSGDGDDNNEDDEVNDLSCPLNVPLDAGSALRCLGVSAARREAEIMGATVSIEKRGVVEASEVIRAYKKATQRIRDSERVLGGAGTVFTSDRVLEAVAGGGGGGGGGGGSDGDVNDGKSSPESSTSEISSPHRRTFPKKRTNKRISSNTEQNQWGYFSVDLEGGEASFLQSLNFHESRPRFITYEGATDFCNIKECSDNIERCWYKVAYKNSTSGSDDDQKSTGESSIGVPAMDVPVLAKNDYRRRVSPCGTFEWRLNENVQKHA